MPVFAITGDWGSGKSTVAALLKARGAQIFDADACVHAIYRDRKNPVYKKVAAAFPRALSNGRIDRKTLGAIVFADATALARLERLVHPVVTAALRTWLGTRAKRSIAVAEIPLLFEKKLQSLFDATILVRVKRPVLLERIRMRHAYSHAYIRGRLALYMPEAVKIKQADFIIDNSATRAQLRKEIDTLWHTLKRYISREQH